MRHRAGIRNKDSLTNGRIGILMGGPSSEREVSLRSGAAVLGALENEGIDAVGIDIDGTDRKETAEKIKNARIDVAFIALHGRFGEDGAIQAILEDLNMPYTGSKIRASRLAIDKVASRRIFELQGLVVPKYEVVSRRSAKRLKRFSYPLVVKPASEGSSIGLSLVYKRGGLDAALSAAFKYDDNVLIEEYIDGREFTVGILDERPLPVVQIMPKNKFYDYEAKYTAGMTEYIVPAELGSYERSRIQRAGLAAHRSLGCRSFSRVDIIMDGAGRPYILEINTVPGLTATSLLPKAAKAGGINFTELCLRLINSSLET